MQNLQSHNEYILGLDIGTNSVGWALLSTGEAGEPAGLVRIGVRIFDAGVEGDIESGRDASRAIKRREARLRRRMLDRRSRRLKKLAGLLQGAGLLPHGDLTTGGARVRFFADIDKAIFPEPVRKTNPHVLPYLLRVQALDRKLSSRELGRAIYHLAQRRGFLSNRKSVRKNDDQEGEVKKGIGRLHKEMQDTGARTLGEYFSKLDPVKERIRARWTAREMFIDEFEKIWTAQAIHHADILTDAFKKKVYRAIFYQRPLKNAKHLIGECELETGRKRTPLAILPAQRFRLLQKVNDLRLGGFDPATGEIPLSDRLSEEHRTILTAALEREGDLSFGKIRKLLGLPKWVRFNFEEGGDKKLIGNRTAAKFREVFGARWDKFSLEEKGRIVWDVRSMQKPEAQYRRGVATYELDGTAARKFGELALEPDYCNLSRQALEKVLPLMEKGAQYATARKALYGDRPAPKPLEELPPLADAPIAQIRNPAVSRALTEVRKIVNGVVREHGKPAAIRIELARDLKKNRKDRQALSKRNQDNRKRREEAVKKILAETGNPHPPGADIEKWLLAEECRWVCPYTGRSITPATLHEFDVEHIIPFPRSLDNTFMNKTLCDAEENRRAKRDRTPWEAYHSNPPRWEQIIQCVQRFRGPAAPAKLERFQLEDLESFEDFTERQLADTRYASRLAIEYLGLLYGTGAQGVDADHTRRIQAGRGAVTKYIRDEFKLSRILGDGGDKNREDHRHHAVDAAAIALTDTKTVKMLSDAAARAERERRRRFGRVRPPWPTFFDDVQEAIGKVAVSHRTSRGVNGPLHEEFFYSKLKKNDKGRECVHIRKPLEKLSRTEIADIVDPVVKDTVLAGLGGGDPERVFADKAHHPKMKSGVPIHSVRIRKYDKTFPIGSGEHERRVISGSNHHVEIFEQVDKKGKPYWDGAVVSTIDAMLRLRAKEPIVRRDHGEGKTFLFSLAQGESVLLKDETGKTGLYEMSGVSRNEKGRVELEFRRNTDARPSKILRKIKGGRVRLTPDSLRELEGRKVTVAPLGMVRWAND